VGEVNTGESGEVRSAAKEVIKTYNLQRERASWVEEGGSIERLLFRATVVAKLKSLLGSRTAGEHRHSETMRSPVLRKGGLREERSGLLQDKRASIAKGEWIGREVSTEGVWGDGKEGLFYE
jgi:hypothetical protein